jgi:transcriptional regulator with XRE-family HTH domain
MSVKLLDTDRVRKLTPLTIQKMLKEQAPDLPVSQTQIYRYYHGEASPRVDVVWELARLFDVVPTYFSGPSIRESDGEVQRAPGRGAEDGSESAVHQLVRAEQSVRAVLDPPHVSTEFFSQRLRELASQMSVRLLDTDRLRKLTPLTIQKMLKEQAPDLPVSQAQIYRYYHGGAPPRVDVVWEMARLFDVDPGYFMGPIIGR